MKILVISQTFAPQKEGGAELVARRTAEHLSQSHEVRVLSLRSPRENERIPPGPDYVDRLPFHTTYLPTVGQRTEYGALKKLMWHTANAIGGVRASDLAAYLDRFQPDVIHAHNSVAFQPQLGRVAAAKSIPIVQHLHDYAYACFRTSMFVNGRNCEKPCFSCRALTSLWRGAVESAVSDAIAVSAFVRDRLRASGIMPSARWHVLHNVEDAAKLKAYARGSRDSDGKMVFGFLGALTSHKGLALLVDAFLSLEPGRARLIVGGTGDAAFVEALRSKSKGTRIDWLGHVDPNVVYGQADVMIVPSLWHEPQALVVTESVSRGLAVIGSDRGGTTEILNAYPNGRLFDPDKPDALADAMRKILDSESRVEDTFDPVSTAEYSYFERLETILQDAARCK